MGSTVVAEGDVSVVAKEGQLTLYGAAGAGLRAGRYGYGDGLIDGDGGDSDDGRGLHSFTLELNLSNCRYHS